MNKLKQRIFALSLCTLLVLTLVISGCSQTTSTPAAGENDKWEPTKTVTFVIWASPGGGSDIYARTLAKALMEETNIPVTINVESHAGGGGAVGMTYVLNQPADGHTVLVTTASWLLTPQTQNLTIGHRSFEPISLVFSEPDVLYVRSDAPYQDANEFIEYARANPGKIRVNGTGSGGREEVCLINFEEKAGIDITYVPSEGGGESIINVLGGHVEAFVSNPGEAFSQVEAGNIRPIINFGDTPIKEEGVLSVIDLGYPDAVSTQLRGLALKGETPENIRQYWEEIIISLKDSPTLKQYADENAVISEFRPGADFFKLSDEQYEMYGVMLRKLGVIQ